LVASISFQSYNVLTGRAGLSTKERRILLDKKHFSVLLYVYRHPYVAFDKLQSKFKKHLDLQAMVESLEMEKKLSFRIADSSKSEEGYEDLHVKSTSHLLCTSDGNEYIENRLSQNTQWNITTAIALFAAIGAYREELAYILQAITKLWK